MAAIKEELIQADQELSIGIITSAVSSKVIIFEFSELFLQLLCLAVEIADRF
jgi:hypothetical protein